LEHFLWAKSIFEGQEQSSENNDVINDGIAKTYGYIGIVFSEKSNYTKALEYYLQSAKIYEKTKNEIQSSKIYNNIGVAYQSQEKDAKALEYFLKSLQLQKKLGNTNIGITQTNIANIYVNRKELDAAFSYYIDAKKSLEQNPNPRAMGEWYNNVGLYYEYKNQPFLAVENWNNAIISFKSIDDKFGLTDTYYYLARYHAGKNDVKQALDFANLSLELSQEIDVLEQQSLSEKLISEIYEMQNNTTQALSHYKQYKILHDSLVRMNDVRKSIESAMSYEFEKKELLQQEKNEKRELLIKEEAKNAQLKIYLGGFIILLLLGMAFLIYNRNTLKKNLTLQKELAEYEQKALHLQMNPHFVFNCLGSISSFIVQNGTDSAIKYLSKFSKLMRLTLEYSKESLIPIDKEIESLDNYLQLEQLRFNDKFNFSITKHPDIEDDVALPPLLIQPFIENAIIHGVIPKKEEGTISIDFSIENESLICVILDDGIGINTSIVNKENSVLAHKSMALDIVKKRLAMITESTSKKATIQIEELNGKANEKGTKVTLNLPLRYINE
jgi:tetratricopeptide (TPR) repeat protein